MNKIGVHYSVNRHIISAPLSKDNQLGNWNTTKYNNSIERGYVYNLLYFVEEDEYRVTTSEEIAINRREEPW